MRLSEFIRDMQHLASSMDVDPEVMLFDTETEKEYRLRPDEGDEGRFDFQILRGDAEIVLEF